MNKEVTKETIIESLMEDFHDYLDVFSIDDLSKIADSGCFTLREAKSTCTCCGENLSQEELIADEGKCFPCLKGNCELCN